MTDKLKEIRERWTRKRWKATDSFDGSDWLVCSCGMDPEGRKWHVTTDGIRASEVDGYADTDAEAIAAAPDDIAYLLAAAERLREQILAVCADSGLRPKDGCTPHMLVRTLGDSERGGWANAESYQRRAEKAEEEAEQLRAELDEAAEDEELLFGQVEHYYDEAGSQRARAEKAEAERDRLAVENAALCVECPACAGIRAPLEPATRRALAAVELAEARMAWLDCDQLVGEEEARRALRMDETENAYRALQEGDDGE